MSINNQILVKEHRGKFYVFDVMAEGWGEWEDDKLISETNYLPLKSALGSFKTRKEAHEFAHHYDSKQYLSAEYGVVDEVLAKDGEAVVVKE